MTTERSGMSLEQVRDSIREESKFQRTTKHHVTCTLMDIWAKAIDAHLSRDAVTNDAVTERLREIAYRDEAKSVTVRADDLRAALESLASRKVAYPALFTGTLDGKPVGLHGTIESVEALEAFVASRKVAVHDGWIFYYADDEGTPHAHYCAARGDIYSQVGVWMCGAPDEGVLSDFGDDMIDEVTETLLAKGAFHPEGDPPCFLRKSMLAPQDEVK